MAATGVSGVGEGLTESLAEVVTGLLADEETSAMAGRQLAEIVDNVEGGKAQAVGAAIRDFGAMQPLLEMLKREDTQQDALRVIGNLASEAVDARAEETKILLHELGGFDEVLPLIYSPSDTTLVYALGAVQNLCTRAEYARRMRQTFADERLRQICQTGKSDLRRFADGCLKNMAAVQSPEYVPAEVVSAQAAAAWGGGLAPRAAAAAYGGGRRVGSTAALCRHHVPTDNHCLFTAISYLCEEEWAATDPAALCVQHGVLERLRAAAARLREVCARSVLDASVSEQAERLALLGFDSAGAYGGWIRDEHHWGGEPELVALAAHFRVEIVVASCESLSLLKYGSDGGLHTVYMLYTGQHYDPLAGPPPSHRRRFPSAVQERPAALGEREASALAIAREQNEHTAQLAAERALPAGQATRSLPGAR